MIQLDGGARFYVVSITTRFACVAEFSSTLRQLAEHVGSDKRWYENGRLLMAAGFLERPGERL